MPNVYSQVIFDKEKIGPQELPTFGAKIIHAVESVSHYLYQPNPPIILYFAVDKAIFDKRENPNRKFIAVQGGFGSIGPDNYEHVASVQVNTGHLLHVLQEVDS